MSFREFTKGLYKENPTFRIMLGMCPTLAVTTSLINGIGMGLATAAVLVCSNAMISLIGGIVPNKIRIPVYVVVIAAFVTITDLSLAAYVPVLHKSLGLFIPLIVVNCIVLGRAEAFANRHGVGDSILDGLGMGLGFTLSLSVIGSIREILGAGTILGRPLLGHAYMAHPFLLFVLPAGAFFTLAILMGIMNRLEKKS
jgi:electron transport complex protein RnfE